MARGGRRLIDTLIAVAGLAMESGLPAPPAEGVPEMSFPIQYEPTSDAPRRVRYTWDADTEILGASLLDTPADVRSRPPVGGNGPAPAGPPVPSGSVEIQGKDGSWVTLDIQRGRISAIEVAIWPQLLRRPSLAPPDSTSVREHVSLGADDGARSALEVPARMIAEVDAGRRSVHFSLARGTGVREGPFHAVRIARDVLLDIDTAGYVAGLWLLNLPPDSIPDP